LLDFKGVGKAYRRVGKAYRRIPHLPTMALLLVSIAAFLRCVDGQQASGKGWLAPMFEQNWNTQQLVGAPRYWKKGALICNHADVEASSTNFWNTAVDGMAAVGYTDTSKLGIIYTRGSKNCSIMCASHGATCYAGAVSPGEGGAVRKGNALDHCSEMAGMESQRGCKKYPTENGALIRRYLCACGPFIPDCVYAKSMGEYCKSAGDPHVSPFLQFTGVNQNVHSVSNSKPVLDYMGVGEKTFFIGIYQDRVRLRVQVRQELHPAFKEVSHNAAVAISGDHMCGSTLEIVAETPNRGVGVDESVPIWDKHEHKLILDGKVYPNKQEFSRAVDDLQCPNICEQRLGRDGEYAIRFLEGTRVNLMRYQNTHSGMSVYVFVSLYMYQETAMATQTPQMFPGAISETASFGLCFADTSDRIDVPCEESLFSPESYREGEDCNDHQDDPFRMNFIPDPISECRENMPDLWRESRTYCRAHCAQSEINECIFDACIFGDLDGVLEVAEACDEEEELNLETLRLPTPKPTFPCEALAGVKFKFNKDRLGDAGVRPKADFAFRRDIWDHAIFHNHGQRHLQKKFYQNAIAGKTDMEVACMCHEYCSGVGTHWFQCNLKWRAHNGHRYGKCQCFNGEPVFKKSKPSYLSGYVSNWVFHWYYGLGKPTRANDLTGIGVTYDVPETSFKTETQEKPHEKNRKTNDIHMAGVGTKEQRQDPANQRIVETWPGRSKYLHIGNPVQEG